MDTTTAPRRAGDTHPAATTTYAYTDSPLGRLMLVGRDGALTGLYLADHGRAPRPGTDWRLDEVFLAGAARQLGEYFAGDRTGFDLEVDLDGTPFQREVWSALRAIPYGDTISYGELARRVGRPTAFRAVGAANGRNPVAVVVPCHRVVAADGGLGGYGWGTDRKAWLLDLEGGRRRLAVS